MGSKPARSETRPEWPVGSQEMRSYLYPRLVKQMRGELTPEGELNRQRQYDAVYNQTAIARERLLRDMGRMPGVPGPERYEGLRRLQEAQIRAAAGIEAQTRVGAQQQAMAQALQYSMQAPGQRQSYRGESISTGAAMGRTNHAAHSSSR